MLPSLVLISNLVVSPEFAGVGGGETGPGVTWWPLVTTGVARELREGGELDFLPELREM